ncbi:MAG: alpha/beta fold hydrolase [Steroidobacteraceae bacterium]
MNATTLVLIPGLMCDAAVWQAQIDAFKSRISIQVAEHGELDSLHAMAQRIVETAPTRFALAGHSMGGRVALEVMRLAPARVSHLALLDTGCHAIPEDKAAEKERALRLGFLRLAQEQGVAAMTRSWVRNMVHPERLHDRVLIDSIVNMFARKSVAVYEAQIRALLQRPEAYPLLAGIHCPTLVLSGHEDVNSPPAANQEMADAIADAQLCILPDCGHMSPQEQPAAVTAQLSRWLARE